MPQGQKSVLAWPRSRSELASVLDIESHTDKTCSGVTQKNARCTRGLAKSVLEEIEQQMDNIVAAMSLTDYTIACLNDMSRMVMCRRDHQNQSRNKAKAWKNLLSACNATQHDPATSKAQGKTPTQNSRSGTHHSSQSGTSSPFNDQPQSSATRTSSSATAGMPPAPQDQPCTPKRRDAPRPSLPLTPPPSYRNDGRQPIPSAGLYNTQASFFTPPSEKGQPEWPFGFTDPSPRAHESFRQDSFTPSTPSRAAHQTPNRKPSAPAPHTSDLPTPPPSPPSPPPQTRVQNTKRYATRSTTAQSAPPPPPSQPREKLHCFRPFSKAGLPVGTMNQSLRKRIAMIERPSDVADGFVYGYQFPDSEPLSDEQTRRGTTMVKIGMSGDTPKRMARWRTQCKYTPRVLFDFKTPHAGHCEKIIHEFLFKIRREEYAGCPVCTRRHREWFEAAGIAHVREAAKMWADWLAEERPYDSDKKLKPKWQRRLDSLDLTDPRCWETFVYGELSRPPNTLAMGGERPVGAAPVRENGAIPVRENGSVPVPELDGDFGPRPGELMASYVTRMVSWLESRGYRVVPPALQVQL